MSSLISGYEENLQGLNLVKHNRLLFIKASLEQSWAKGLLHSRDQVAVVDRDFAVNLLEEAQGVIFMFSQVVNSTNLNITVHNLRSMLRHSGNGRYAIFSGMKVGE